MKFVSKKPKNNGFNGGISLTDLTSDEFFTLLDEIQSTIVFLKNLEVKKDGE